MTTPATDRAYAPEVAVWADEAHAPLVAQLLDLMGQSINPIGVGGPRGSALDDLAKSLDAEPIDDLRQLLVQSPSAYLLLAIAQDEKPADLAAALANGTHILTVEPCFTSLNHYEKMARAKSKNAAMPGRLIPLPRFTQTPGYLAITDPNDILGDRRSLILSTLGNTQDGSLFMRLHDTWDTALRFCDLPDTIHASLASDVSASDNPRDLTGRVWAHATCPGDCSVVLAVADNTPTQTQTLNIVGDTGQLTVSATGYQLYRNDGTIVDEKQPGTTPGRVDQMANQWRRLLDHANAPDEPGTRHEQAALCCTLACLLSAKTGQPESPKRVMEMSKG